MTMSNHPVDTVSRTQVPHLTSFIYHGVSTYTVWGKPSYVSCHQIHVVA